MNGLVDPQDLPAVAKSIALLPKSNPSRPRVVVITHGAESTIMLISADPDNPKVFPVPPLPKHEIVDTNAAGDAFAGGFLGAFVAGKTLDECVEIGHKLAGICVGQVAIYCCCFVLLLLTKDRHRLAHSINGQRSRSYRFPRSFYVFTYSSSAVTGNHGISQLV